MRYLTQSEIKTRLNLGKTVEQWLNPEFDKAEELTILKWLELDKENSSTYVLRICQVYDEGDGDTLDFYAFSDVDPDDEYEEEFESLEEMLDFISIDLKIIPDKFLNAGMCQEEYKNYLKNRK